MLIPDSRFEYPVLFDSNAEIFTDSLTVDFNHQFAPDFCYLFKSKNPEVIQNGHKWEAGSPGRFATVTGEPYRDGVKTDTYSSITIPTKHNKGGAITLVVQNDPSVTKDAYGRIIEGSSSLFYLRRNNNDLNISARVDYLVFGFNISTNIWDGDQHIVTFEFPKNTVTGPFNLWVDGVLEDSLSPGTQGSADIDATLYVGNVSANNRASGLLFKMVCWHVDFNPLVHENINQFLVPK